MAWVKIDDQFPEHPKVAQAGPLALAMQVAALCYCNRKLTDGFIPRGVARTLLDWEIVTEDDVIYTVSVTSGMSGQDVEASWVIDLLVSTGMWEIVPGGYMVHDYHDYQPSKAEVEAEKRQKSDAGKKGAAARWHGTSHGTSHGTRDGRTMAERCPDPDPVPKEPNTSSSEPVGSRRADVDGLCSILVASMVERGLREPTVTKAWRDAGRLLIDRDKVPADEAERVLHWTIADEFWSKNVLSMPTFRKQYDRLKLQADGANVRPIRQAAPGEQYRVEPIFQPGAIKERP